MTIDDAIIVLKWLHNNDYVSRFMIDEVKEATNIAIKALEQEPCPYSTKDGYCQYDDIAETIPTEQEPKTGWNNHQIACMLADLFGDACACNYNGIDEWLSELCDFKDTCCPNPVGVACWEQFLKHTKSRYCEGGYEMRMVEPQETETWNGYHGQITAPKGTFERIFNDADDDNDI